MGGAARVDGEPEKQCTQKRAERDRVEALSDGVFAVALTLLALELHVPQVTARGSPIALATALLQNIPKLASLIVSFVTICVVWRNHHRLFVMVRHLDEGLFWRNANLLLWISLIPFPTALMGDYPFNKLAVSYYGMVMLVMGVGFVLLRWHLQRHPELLRESVDQVEFRRGTLYTVLLGPVAYAAAVGLAWVSPYLAFACYVGIGLYFVFPHSTRPRG